MLDLVHYLSHAARFHDPGHLTEHVIWVFGVVEDHVGEGGCLLSFFSGLRTAQPETLLRLRSRQLDWPEYSDDGSRHEDPGPCPRPSPTPMRCAEVCPPRIICPRLSCLVASTSGGFLRMTEVPQPPRYVLDDAL